MLTKCIVRIALPVLALAYAGLTGCNNSQGSSHVAAVASSSTSAAIFGTPAESVTVGAAYSFQPSVSATAGRVLKFNISNRPAWAAFDSSNGALSGKPTAANVGSYADVTISVSDGLAAATLKPFTITVMQSATAAVTLTWTPPSTNTDGTTSTDLEGYRLYYGSSPSALNHVVTTAKGDTSYVFNQLASGTWYFAVTAFNAAKVESGLSAVVPIQLGS